MFGCSYKLPDGTFIDCADVVYADNLQWYTDWAITLGTLFFISAIVWLLLRGWNDRGIE